jgi:hypothetical protein
MTAHHVAELCLRVRAEAGSAQDLRPRAERFTRAVLERCADLLEARAPGRRVLIRRLPLRWRLREAALGGPAALERCAADIAAAIEEAARQAGVPTPDGDLAVFDDEAHWRACHLFDGLHGRAGAWFYSSLKGEGDPVEALCAAERRDLVFGVLARLAHDGRLIEVLAALSHARTAALAQALGVLPPRAEMPSDGEDLAEGEATPAAAAEAPLRTRLVECARGLPATLPMPALLLALYVQAHALLGPAATAASVHAAVTATFAAHQRLTEMSAAHARETATAPVPPASQAPLPADGKGVQPPQAAPPAQALPPATSIESPAEPGYLTGFGGLFYLLTCALELDLGESLWRACLPEGDVLAHVAAAILGPEATSDPAPYLFGGVEPGRPFPPVAPEQQQDVAAATGAALAAALPRRGLAALPEIVLDLVSPATGRLLVAAVPGSPLVLFAWPAPAPPSVVAGLRAFLGAWPRSAPPPHARPALAELGGAGRLRPAPDARVSRNILLPEAPSTEAAALLAQAAGALCGLFAARAGALVCPDAAALVRRYLALPARVTRTPGEMTVTLSADSIDLSVRRAGLDRDPGRVPWLARVVRLVFQGVQDQA